MKLDVTAHLSDETAEMLSGLLKDHADALSAFLAEDLPALSAQELSSFLREPKPKTSPLYAALITDGPALLHATLCRVTPDLTCSLFAYTVPSHRRQGLAADAFDALCDHLAQEYPEEELHSFLIGTFPEDIDGYLLSLGYEKETEYLMSAESPAYEQADCELTLGPALESDSFDAMYEEIFDSPAPVYEEICSDPSSTPYFLFRKGRRVGCAVLTKGEQDVCLSHFGILPAYRRTGLAGAALHAISVLCARPLTVQVSSGNLPALNLYRSSGFTVLEEAAAYDLYI